MSRRETNTTSLRCQLFVLPDKGNESHIYHLLISISEDKKSKNHRIKECFPLNQVSWNKITSNIFTTGQWKI